MTTPRSGSDAFETISFPPLTLTLFGPMQALVHGVPLPHLRSRKALWLLALLTLRHGRPVEREWLAGTLWPNAASDQSYANLRSVLNVLRGALGSESVRLQSPSRHTLALDLADAEVDLLAFDAAIARGVKGDLSELERAVEMYRGPLLEGCGEEWISQDREVREQDCLQALQTLAHAATTSGNYSAAAGYWRRAVALAPLWDAAQRGLMQTLANTGDSNAALLVYREFVQQLKAIPPAVPDPETTALYQRLRNQARRRSHAPALLEDTAADPQVVGYLPHPLTELVGREDERSEVAERLRRTRLVTLTGPGGIGKTRLAMEVASEVVAEYPDGVWQVALEAINDDEDGKRIIQQIASVLKIKEETGHTLLESVTAYLHPRRLLLLLDNCEHLLATSAQIAAHLLRECPGLRLLATSREALGLTGETAWVVPPLETPPPTEHLPTGAATLLRVLMGYESVQLFVERAQAVQKTFDLTGSNALAVARICSCLEGIPLAIELAAARVRALTVDQIAARLEDHLTGQLDLLTGGNRTALARQQTLRSALDWSYTLLSAAEQQMLRCLSVFTGGWTLEAAESVCAGEGISSDAVLDLLTSLVDKSLVVFQEGNAAQADGRYRLLEMVRQYAAEKLQASDETEAARVRHRDYLLALAEEADKQLHSDRQEYWLTRLDQEHDNLRAALAWNVRTPAQDKQKALRLAGALWQFWDMRGHHSEGRERLHELLAQDDAQQRTAARARALTGAAALAHYQGDYATAREMQQQSLAILRHLGDKRPIAAVLANQGMTAWAQGDYDAAGVILEESLSIHREIQHPIGTAQTLDILGVLRQWQGDYPTAQALYEESLEIHRQLSDPRGIAFSLLSLGGLATVRARYADAQALFEESLEMQKQLGDRRGMAISVANLGLVANLQGDTASARLLYEEGMALFQELGNQQGMALTLSHMGVLAKDEGDLAQAQALLEQGLAQLRLLGDRSNLALSLNYLGDVATDLGDYDRARALFEESLSLFRTLKDRVGVANSMEGLAALLHLQSDTRKAVRLWGAAHHQRESIGSPLPLRERRSYEQQREEARTALGDAVFAAAWEEGRTLSWEQAAAYALDQKTPDPSLLQAGEAIR